MRLARSAGGSVALRRNKNRITESATKGSRDEAKIKNKSEEGDTRLKRKMTRRKDKNEPKKEQGMVHGERQKGEEKTQKKREKERKMARVSVRFYVDYLNTYHIPVTCTKTYRR